MIASSLDARRELETISDRPVATALAPHLAKLTSLAELNLSSNRIGFFTIDQLRWILRKVECLLLE